MKILWILFNIASGYILMKTNDNIHEIQKEIHNNNDEKSNPATRFGLLNENVAASIPCHNEGKKGALS
jgi:hypothetical protein